VIDDRHSDKDEAGVKRIGGEKLVVPVFRRRGCLYPFRSFHSSDVVVDHYKS